MKLEIEFVEIIKMYILAHESFGFCGGAGISLLTSGSNIYSADPLLKFVVFLHGVKSKLLGPSKK